MAPGCQPQTQDCPSVLPSPDLPSSLRGTQQVVPESSLVGPHHLADHRGVVEMKFPKEGQIANLSDFLLSQRRPREELDARVSPACHWTRVLTNTPDNHGRVVVGTAHAAEGAQRHHLSSEDNPAFQLGRCCNAPTRGPHLPLPSPRPASQFQGQHDLPPASGMLPPTPGSDCRPADGGPGGACSDRAWPLQGAWGIACGMSGHVGQSQRGPRVELQTRAHIPVVSPQATVLAHFIVRPHVVLTDGGTFRLREAEGPLRPPSL